jgi:hypothetical protein
MEGRGGGGSPLRKRRPMRPTGNWSPARFERDTDTVLCAPRPPLSLLPVLVMVLLEAGVPRKNVAQNVPGSSRRSAQAGFTTNCVLGKRCTENRLELCWGLFAR